MYLDNGQIVLVIDKREGEAKSYKSVVSIWESAKQVKKGAIEVNHPLKYKGYSFYQSNYDPKNPTYSGILVVRDPGLSFVYTGFGMLCAGVVYIFYVKPKLVSRKTKAQ